MGFDHSRFVSCLKSEMLSKGDHKNYIEYLSELSNSDTSQCKYEQLKKLISDLFINCNYAEQFDEDEGRILTRNYDQNYYFYIKQAYIGGKIEEGLMPNNPLKICYIYLTFFRRNEMYNEFLLFYALLPEKAKDNKLLKPFRYQNFIYTYRNKLLIENAHAENYRYAFELLSLHEIVIGDDIITSPIVIIDESEIQSDITFCSIVTDVLNANMDRFTSEHEIYLKYYNKVLHAAESLTKNKKYALYYSKLAAVQLLGLKLNINSIDCKIIKENVQKAIDIENSTEAGVRRKTIYLNQMAEINQYEIAELQKKLKTEMTILERKSLKKFSVFCAFIVFAVGLITDFVSNKGSTQSFNEVIGYFFILFGIAALMFMVLDIVIIESLFPEDIENIIEGKIKKDLLKNKIFRGVLEFFISASFIVLGILFGLNIIT